jgi:hypothetical protein
MRAAKLLEFDRTLLFGQYIIEEKYPADPYPLDYSTWSHIREATQLCLETGVRKVAPYIFDQRYATDNMVPSP